ncbi:MAG TPA: CBS domain-containing protein [Balneolaceae bacterium]|nr:CBS domain-containing protein [Balneolaceae bacterium]
MLINKSIIAADFEPLRTADSVETGRERMRRQGVKKLPVIDSATNKLIGEVTYNQLHETQKDVLIVDLNLGESAKVYGGQHLFEAAKLMLQYEMKALPVVDNEWTYLGIITKREVLDTLTKMLNLAEYGSVLTVELNYSDFTISEIVQIIEVEDAKILGLTVERPNEENQAFEVSIKVNLQDISRVSAALRRYGYTVLTGSESEVLDEDIETRAGELLRYLDM